MNQTMKTKTTPRLIGLLIVMLLIETATATVTDIGDRRELFVEDSLIERLEGGTQLVMHRPIPREISIVHDAPWEGTGSGYHSVFEDDGLYRMYYKSWQLDPLNAAQRDPNDPPNPRFSAYAESDDGIHWRKPELGLHAFEGSTANNIVMLSEKVGAVDVDAAHPAFFKDTNPAAPADARYKAIFRSSGEEGLLPFKSADGLRWEPMSDHPVITDGKFDSQNLAFWDDVAGVYRAYWRSFTPPEKEDDTGIRSIRTGTSPDFINWQVIGDLTYEDSPLEQLYTNQVKPYHRAPHLLIGFPNRYIERGHEHEAQIDAASARIAGNAAAGDERSEHWSHAMKSLPELEHRKYRAEARERYGIAMTESLFMASRDGVHFKRWNDAFLPPGIERPGTWNYGNQYIAWHVVETASALAGAPNELSMYAVESYWTEPGSALRRYTLRLDGFVSVRAPSTGGELVTKPIRFTGTQLALNFATSVAGSVRVEIQDEAGNPLPGFSLADSAPLYGNTVDRAIAWKHGGDLGELVGKTVRLRFVLEDADLYAYRFQP